MGTDEDKIACPAVGFVTSRMIGLREGVLSGWQEESGRQAFVVQGENRFEKHLSKSAIELLRNMFWRLDYVVFYLPRGEGQVEVLNLAKLLPSEKVIFVACICDIYEKEAILRREDFQAAQIIVDDGQSSCGGAERMFDLHHAFLVGGELPKGRLVGHV